MILRSVYHCFDGFPCQSVVSDYPYSPRWSAEEMSERTRLVDIVLVVSVINTV